MKQLTREQAKAIFESGEWKDWTDEEIVRFQLFQKPLCVPFSRFHEAVESVLGREVFYHEFAHADNIRAEYGSTRKAPTFDEILAMLSADKPVILVVKEGQP